MIFFVFYNNVSAANALKETLHTNFKIKDLGELTHALGMKIERNKELGRIKISQKQYLLAILAKFGMLNCKPVATPLDLNTKLSSANEGDNVDVPYRH